MTVPVVGVIVPTVATAERAPLLLRALETVTGQEGVRAVPIVVVNGPRAERELVDELRRRDDVVTVTLREASLPAALSAGRARARTEWLSELDDDDQLLPGALRARVDALHASPEAHAVVTNGIRRVAQKDELHWDDVDLIAADPLRALMRSNWLLPGSWLLRSDAVPAALFERMPKYLECTYLAVRLALGGPLRFLPEPTVVYNADTPGSESKSDRYVLGQAAALERILELDLPPDVRALFRRRLAPACHESARLLARTGRVRAALRWQVRALGQPGGWRFAGRSARVVHPRLAG